MFGLRQGCSVVGLAAAAGRDYDFSIVLADRQCAGHQLGHYIVPGAVLRLVDCHAAEGHVIAARSGTFAMGAHAREAQAADAALEAVDFFQCPVVCRCSTVRGQLHARRGNRQRACGCFDVVVVGIRACVQRIGERIAAASRIQLAAGHIVGRAFTVHESVAAHRHGVVRQRLAVVGLAVRRARQCNATLRDLQFAGHNCIIVSFFCRLDFVRNVSEILDARNSIRPGLPIVNAVLEGNTLEYFPVFLGGRSAVMSRAVIRSFIGNGGNRHILLGLPGTFFVDVDDYIFRALCRYEFALGFCKRIYRELIPDDRSVDDLNGFELQR